MARKILLADDSVTAQNMGRKILADAGYEVVTVNNGSAALKKIAEHKPDVIVLDVYMPGYSGLEVCQRLKENAETARIPVLLTVGKLEPFKPEEARRSRADGFIVKPFEASELLSALSKLEDKIVPRGEGAKPGRFARVNAALDEGKYDKTVAIDEDNGWKDRISFPSKKKAKEPEPEQNPDEAAIYNPVNKDLRTVVDHKAPAAHPEAKADAKAHDAKAHDAKAHDAKSHDAKNHEAKAEEAKVDLGALAPEGLPKDVTPEEIAALAAAAAQVKGKMAEAHEHGPAVVDAASEVKTAEVKAEAKVEAVASAPADQNVAEQKSEAKSTELPEDKPEAISAASAEAQKHDEARNKDEEKIEAPAAPTAADVMAAISSLESSASGSAGSAGNGSAPHTERIADEPVTMAVAAGAGSAAVPARWSAVAVALAPEEASISLEHEMQKAYAAFAAAEAAHATTTEAQTASEPAPVAAASVSEPVSVPATPAPEVAQPITEVANAATEAISEAVKELEAVAASYEAQMKPAAAEPFTEESDEADSPAASEPVAVASASSDETPARPELAQPESPVAAHNQTASEELKEEPKEEPEQELKAEAPAAEDPAKDFESVPAVTASEAEADADAPPTTTAEADAVPAVAAPPTRTGAANESDVAATTAAAWANWRRTRETSRGTSKDESARAVAAGAEKSPEDAAPESDTEGIASIVDSVLADLRPKIYEEISRKMGKKK